jgi:hypothetical protein
MEKKKSGMHKSIIMMMLLALLLMAATYAWMVNMTHSDITALNFLVEDNIPVTFLGANPETGAYDDVLEEGDLQLTGLKPGDSTTVKIKVERYSGKDKELYIKLIGVGVEGYDGRPPRVITVGGIGYDISSFITIDIRTTDTDESVTVTGQPIPLSSTDHESILDILELVQRYRWPTDHSDYEVMYLNLTVTVNREITVPGGTLKINSFQKQKVTAGRLNVQAVDPDN